MEYMIFWVFQDISYGIKISWQESYLVNLMKQLTDWILRPMTEPALRTIGHKSLTVLVNVCYGNLPAIYALMRTIDTKDFIVHLINLKVCIKQQILVTSTAVANAVVVALMVESTWLSQCRYTYCTYLILKTLNTLKNSYVYLQKSWFIILGSTFCIVLQPYWIMLPMCDATIHNSSLLLFSLCAVTLVKMYIMFIILNIGMCFLIWIL